MKKLLILILIFAIQKTFSQKENMKICKTPKAQTEAINKDGNKIYKSEIQVSLTKKISDTQNDPVVQDKLEIFYRSSPTVFEVSRVLYNNQLVFTKVPDQPNVATITK